MLTKQRRQSSRRTQGFQGWVWRSGAYKYLIIYNDAMPLTVGSRCDVYFDSSSGMIALKQNPKGNMVTRHSTGTVRLRCDSISLKSQTNLKTGSNFGKYDLILVPEVNR